MLRKLLTGAAVLALVLTVCGVVRAQQAPPAPDKPSMIHASAVVGKMAPDFALKDAAGKEHKLADYKGKVVVLEWTNFKCPYVDRLQKKERTMQKTFESFKGKDVVWLAVDSTKPEYEGGHAAADIKKWAEEEGVKLPYPVLVDADAKVGQMYGARTTPHMFVIDKEGKLVYAGAIDDDQPGTKKAEERKNYVSLAVKAVLDNKPVETAQTQPYGCTVKFAAQGAPAGEKAKGESPAKDKGDKPKTDKPEKDKAAPPAKDKAEAPAKEKTEAPAKDKTEKTDKAEKDKK